MEQTNTFKGTYGNGTQCDYFVYGRWYVIEGSVNVNKAPYGFEFKDGLNLESIGDVDVFTWPEPILSVDELMEAVDYE